MVYLMLLPGLICGLALCVEDMRARRIPRLWVALGFVAQIATIAAYAIAVNDMFIIVQALLFAILSTLIQLGLAMIKPGSLGFGDVTCMIVIGLAPGMFGLTAVVMWWLSMGALGILWLAIWPHVSKHVHSTRLRKKTPFAPVIVLAAIVAVSIASLL
nr:peptidase A24 [Bifidobacterium goeldii]